MPSPSARPVAACLVLILVSAPLLGASASAAPGGDAPSVADLFRLHRQLGDRQAPAGFVEDLQASAPGTPTEAVVQFRGGVAPADRTLLTGMGAEVIRAYRAVPGFHIRAPAVALVELSAHPRVFYIEPNARLAPDQEVSTTVVNASLLWETLVRGAQNLPGGVTGAGVTVAVVDTGIDAGHPDLDFGVKTLANVIETAPGVWVSTENADTAVGHGTHVAGTVAGNGEASAGARRGVAPGANLVGVTIANPTVADYQAALDWVYDNSRPGNNPFNIRVATNSWHDHGTHGEWDPQASLTQTIEALAYENNVVTTWSAGNHGREDPPGEQGLTSGQGSTPVAIKCSAFARDGSAVADFSSRSLPGLVQTYPDVGGPGVAIWSTAARRTSISAGSYIGGNTNPYYLAISGTSMSTPHVAGAVALLWQAAPSMGVSDRHEDYNGTEADAWADNPRTRIHEAEWILESTARYVPLPAAAVSNGSAPEEGHGGLTHDHAQGYGTIDVHRAVTVALALEKLRKDNPERDVTVDDALREAGRGAAYFEPTAVGTDRLHASWQGEYGRFTDLGFNTLTTANQTKLLYIPPGTASLEFDLSYQAVDYERKSVGDLTYAVDWNGDGTNEVTGSLTPAPPTGHKGGTVSVPSDRGGSVAWVNVIGYGVKVQTYRGGLNYIEWRSHYSIGVTAALDLPQGGAMAPVDKGNYSAMLAPWWPSVASEGYQAGPVAVNTSYIDIRGVALAPLPPSAGGGGVLPFGGLFLALLVAAAAAVFALSRVPAVRRRAARLPLGPAAIGAADRAARATGRALDVVRRAAARAGVSQK